MTLRVFGIAVPLIAAAVVTFAVVGLSGPASAARSWKDWVNSGYCPPGTCTPLGYWRAGNVKNCRPRPNCRWR
jgi:hypothetical protein